MASNTSNILKDQPAGVLDAEGYAICPDCGTRVNCGRVGVANLELRHRGTKACRAAAQKRDKSKTKSTSILSFLKQRPTPVPSTVTPAHLVTSSSVTTQQGRAQPESVDIPLQTPCQKEAAIVTELRHLIARLPHSVPEGLPGEPLSIFGQDPRSFDNLHTPSEDLWETIINPTLKSVLGWGGELNLKSIIRRGAMGMDGLLTFIQYFVDVRDVPQSLVEGKLTILMEALRLLTNTSPNHSQIPPASTNATQTSKATGPSDAILQSQPALVHSQETDIIDVDTLVIKTECQGYILQIPEEKTPHTAYPYALHSFMSLPWNYSVNKHVMTLHAHACTPLLESDTVCLACRKLEKNSIIEGILRRMRNGIPENTNYPYHGFDTLTQLLVRRNDQVRYLQLRGINQAHSLMVRSEALSDYKRLGLAIASGRYERVDRLMHIALRQRRGIRGILAMYEAAAAGVYKPRSYTERDDMRGLLLWRLGGNRIAHIAHRALDLPGLTTLRRRTIMPAIVPSPSMPTVEEVEKNAVATFESIQEFLDDQVTHQVIMFDEIATEKRVRWDHQTNMFLGICREHGAKASLEFLSEDDMEELFRAVDEGEVHEAGEATIGALGLLTDNHRLYPARPILISGDCKKETGAQHAKLLDTVLKAVNLTKSSTHLRVVSIASDGETRRGASLVQLTFKRKLSTSSNIYSLVSPLHLMNLHVGDDDITADKDWKHVFKRFRNLLLRPRGIAVLGFRITPSIIEIHLREAGCTAEHIRAVFNPDDAQDVKLAFDFLRDIWSLPPASGNHTPAFHSAREALRILGRLLYHIVFPYICIDLSLSEQIEHLSTAMHLALVLYRHSQNRFLPTLLYIDIAIMIKNVIFCIAKAKIDNPHSSFWIILLGTDRLEELFGVLRTMIGTDANLDVLQLGNRITGTTEVLNILAKYPEWDRSPRRLKLPPLTRDSRELPDTTDHIKPGSWKGDTKVKNVSLQTSWKRGRHAIEDEYPQLASILKEIDLCPDADILAPVGKLLVHAPLDDDDLDESLDLAEAVVVNNDNAYPTPSQEARVEIEDAIAEEVEILSSRPNDHSRRGTFPSFITVEGKQISKSQALALRSKYKKKTSSTDRLKRVQEMERYSSQKPLLVDFDTSNGTSVFGDKCLMVQDPIATLVLCEGQAWLCVGEVNNISHDSQSVQHIPLEILYEETVSVSFQIVGLRPATSDDDSTFQYDWCSCRLPLETTCTIPGRFIDPLDVETQFSITRDSFYLFKSSSLVAKSAALFERLQFDLKKLVIVKRSKDFPYRESSGKACFICQTGFKIDELTSSGTDLSCPYCSPEYPFDVKFVQRIFAHIGAHILYDPTVKREEEPCGLCLRPSLVCKVYLNKGKGSKGGLRIDKARSSCPMKFLRFTFSVAAASTTSSPCSNVPIFCPLCPKTAPAVFKYNWKSHFTNAHPHATFTNYASTGSLTKFEKSEMMKIWKDRRKVPTKRVMKDKGLPQLEVSTAHSSAGALGIASATETGLGMSASISDEIDDEPVWPSDSPGSDSDKYTSAWDPSGVNNDDESFDEGSGGEQVEDGAADVLDGAEDNEADRPIAQHSSAVEKDAGLYSTNTDRNQEHRIQDNSQVHANELVTLPTTANPIPNEDRPIGASGRPIRKRKARVFESLGDCLCGRNALASEAVVECSNRGCETRLVSGSVPKMMAINRSVHSTICCVSVWKQYHAVGYARHALRHLEREDDDDIRL
ncbi:hypothetical protein H0H92_002534 [Tricholoma furcatifolium]|nr:hypothetical protein H0H92_002534 [Tricholoma furcatifolium]